MKQKLSNRDINYKVLTKNYMHYLKIFEKIKHVVENVFDGLLEMGFNWENGKRVASWYSYKTCTTVEGVHTPYKKSLKSSEK